MIWKVVFSGVGGQGVISAGIILGEAAVIYEDRYAVQSQSYGAEMRGGVSRADVTISDDPVIYPKVDQAHVLVCLHRKGLHAHLTALRPGGILINDTDEAPVRTRVDCRQYPIPITATVRSELGTTRGVNIAVLGVLVALTRVVGEDAVRDAVTARYGASRRTLEENLRALDLGIGIGREIVPETPYTGDADRRGRHATSSRI